MYNGDWCPLVALYMCDFLIHLDILQPNTCLEPCNFWTDSCILGCGALRWRRILMWLVATPVLLQYDSVPQSTSAVLLRTAPVLLRTTMYYSSTTPYYSSTTLYYKVLLQYYSVLQSTTLQLEEPGAAICQGEVFLTVDLGRPSFEYLVTSFTTSFIPRSRPRSLPLQKACFQAAISKQFALNMTVWLKDWYLC